MNTKLFGQMLLEKGYINREQLLEGLAEQRRSIGTLGDLAVAVGMLSLQDVDAIHRRQHAKNESFSQAAVALGLLTEKQLADLLHPHSAERLLLGQILAAYGYLDEKTLQEALTAHSSEKREDEASLLKLFRRSDLMEIGALSVSVMKSVYKKAVGTPVSCQAIPARKAISANEYVWAQVIAQPDESFLLGIQVGERDACRLASSVLGMPMDRFDDLVEDSVGEFLNLVTGHVCGNLDHAEAGLSASTPMVQGPGAFMKSAVPDIAVLCTGDEVEFTFIVARPTEEVLRRDTPEEVPTRVAESREVESPPLTSVHPFEPQISLT